MTILGWNKLGRLALFIIGVITHCATAQIFHQTNNLPHAKTLIDFGKTFMHHFDQLNYTTSQEFVVNIPGIDKELSINWGFGGSGHIFSPLPWTPIELRSYKKNNTNDATPFNIVDLGKVLLQDKITQEAHQFPFLPWLAEEGQLSPIKLFSIKLFLLVKDYQKQHIDLATVQSEIVRLLIRLCLTHEVGIIDSSKAFSTYLPEVVKKFISSEIPGILPTIDTLWATLINQNIFNDTTTLSLSLPRTVYACSFETKEQTDLYFEHLKNYPIEHFPQNKGIKQFTSIRSSYKPTNMPEELHKASLQTTTLPQLIKVHTTDGQHWIGCITDRLGMIDTLSMITIVLINTIKKYVQVNQNPPVSITKQFSHPTIWQEKQKQQARIQAFLQTPIGKESAQRLEQKISMLEHKHSADEQTPHSNIDQLTEKLNIELEALQSDEKLLKDKLSIHKKTLATAPKATRASIERKIAALEKDYNLIIKKINTIQHTINQQIPQPAPTPANLDKEYLDELYQLVRSLKARGEEIPTDVQMLITELEQRTKTTSNDGTTQQKIYHLESMLQKKNAHIEVYEEEIALLKQSIDSYLNMYQHISNPTKRKIEELKFTTSQMPLFQAYIDDLENKKQEFLANTEQMNELLSYYQMSQTISISDFTKEQIEAFKALEHEFNMINNHIFSNQIYNFFSHQVEINILLNDILHNGAYADVKKYLYDSFALIISKSDHIKEFAATYGYLIEKCFPDFLPTFEQCIKTA